MFGDCVKINVDDRNSDSNLSLAIPDASASKSTTLDRDMV